MVCFRLLLPVTFFLCMPLALTAQEARKPLAFTSVTVIDCTGAAARPDVTVVVTGDRITAIGKNSEVTIPNGATVIEASGKFMIPGLWDMHVHAGSNAAGLFLANGVVGIRVMWGTPSHLADRGRAGELANQYDGADTSRFPGIHLEGSPQLPFLRSNVASPIIDGPRPFWPGSIAIHNAEQAKQTVRDVKKQGYDFIKVYSRLPRDAYLAIIDESKREGIRVAGHVPYAVSASEASDAGQSTIEHLTGIPRGGIRTRDTFDEEKAQALFARFAKNKTWQVPTLTVLKWHAYADRKELTQDERLRFTKRNRVNVWRARAAMTAASPTVDFAMLRRSFAQNLRIVGQMHKSKVRILAGTDTANPFCIPGFSLHDELELLVAAGLTPMESLQAATKSPAEYLGRLNDFGTVQRGKLADLVLLDANPLDDINNVRKISSVVFGGHYFSREQLDGILAERKLEHSILELADSFSQERLESLIGNKLISRIRRLRMQDHSNRRFNVRTRCVLGQESGQDATLLFPHMPNLEDLFINNTDFNDRGLSRLATLNNLKTLEVGSTQITDKGLSHMAATPKLQALSLADTKITDAGLRQLAGLSRLKQLDLSGTKVTNTSLALMRDMSHLEELKLDRTQLDDESLLLLATVNQLKLLHLAGTPITDEGARHLNSLTNLTHLSLADTDITDAGLKHLRQLKALESIDLTNTTVTLQGVEQFKHALPSCVVSISKTPQLTVKLEYPTRDAFAEKGESVILKAKIRATIGAEVRRVEFLDNGSIIAVKNSPPYEATWKGESTGRHDIRVRVFDKSDKQTGAHQNSIFVGVHGVKRTVNFSLDDAEEQGDGSILLDSANLELVEDDRRGDQVIGMRFRDISIPKDARITKAYLLFTSSAPSNKKTELSVRAELSPNAKVFEDLNHNVSSRRTTDMSVKWAPKPWRKRFERKENQKTPDLSALIQAVVSQKDWKQGNALVLLITGKGRRNAVASDGSGVSPILHIEYAPN